MWYEFLIDVFPDSMHPGTTVWADDDPIVDEYLLVGVVTIL